MEIKILQELFTRDLGRLREEIAAYKSDEKLWHTKKGISNSGGNLCLHLIGNLNTYIGKELGNTSYVRNRPLEFSQKGIPKTVLLRKIDETLVVVSDTLLSLNDSALEKEYPVLVFDKMNSTRFTLIHLLAHLSYHLGQINYHRRLLDHVDINKFRFRSVVGLN